MKQTSVTSLSAKQLRKAATIKDKIETLQGELSKLLGDASSSEASDTPVKKRKKHRMTAAGRAKIAAAAKARWAKVRAANK